jgi:hypothetical protein
MITDAQREILADIFDNTEALDKITVEIDPVSRSVTIRYEDLDDEWFRELAEAALHKRSDT